MSRRWQRGFTLIELIIFIVVVGAALAGILSVSTTVVKSSADPMVRKQALAIAQSLMEEILLKEYNKPAGSTALGYKDSGTRNGFDCVSDYDGYLTAGGMVDVSGTPVSGLSRYNVTPAVAVSSTTLGGVSVYKVVVTVTGPQGQVALTGYRGDY
jgi:MSHA pilin protein MshD